jgi:hypothetical protein
VLPPVDPAAIGQQAGAGLQALSELVQVSPEIRQAAGVFRTIFESALIEVDVLGDYKDLHDLLHQMQFFCYEPITNEVDLFPEERALDMLDSYERNLRDLLKGVKDVAVRGRVSNTDTNWFEDMAQAQLDLRAAVDNEDAGLLRKAVFRLKRIIATQPVRINTRLVDSARTLRLPALLQALENINNELQSLHLVESKTTDFQSGVSALTKLATSLEVLLKDHDNWQAVDTEIRMIDSLQEADPTALELSWPDLKNRITFLYQNKDADWAKNLAESCARLDEVISTNNPKRIRRFFKGFWREANHRFYEVDIDLKTLCSSLRQIGEPLNAILRSFA